MGSEVYFDLRGNEESFAFLPCLIMLLRVMGTDGSVQVYKVSVRLLSFNTRMQ